jgi:Domain of unknown function (DUF5666)
MAYLISLIALAMSLLAPTAPLSGPVESLPDQAQVRLLGRVTSISPNGRTMQVDAAGMTFEADFSEQKARPSVRVGDRVLLTGLLRSQGRVLVQTIQTVSAPAGGEPLIAMLISTNLHARRLTVRTDHGRRLRVRYGPETTVVRLGRRSSAEELKFGDRLWIGQAGLRGSGTASRIEVMAATGGRFSGVGRVTAIDTERQQLRVLFGRRARTVLIDKAAVRRGRGSSALAVLKLDASIRISGVERRGVIVARSVELAPGDTSLRR